MFSFLTSQLGRYIFKQTLLSIFLALAGVAAAVLLVDVVEQLRTIGARVQLSLPMAVFLTSLKAPQLLEQTLPFVVLIGTMVALTRLNRRSELIAIRAAGISAWRFLAPAAAAAFTVGMVASLALNPLAARLYEAYEGQVADLMGDNPDKNANRGIWLRQGDKSQQVVIHADSVDTGAGALAHPAFTFFDVEKDGSLRFDRRMSADRAELKEGFWQLTGVREARPGAPVAYYQHLALPTALRSSALFDRFVNPASLSFWRLPGYIAQAKASGVAPVRYELAWYSLIAAPLFLVAMASLGAVFSLRLQRLGGVAQLAGTGVAIGFGLYFSSRLVAAFAEADLTPPLLAAWAAPAVGFFSAMAVLSYIEDG